MYRSIPQHTNPLEKHTYSHLLIYKSHLMKSIIILPHNLILILNPIKVRAWNTYTYHQNSIDHHSIKIILRYEFSMQTFSHFLTFTILPGQTIPNYQIQQNFTNMIIHLRSQPKSMKTFRRSCGRILVRLLRWSFMFKISSRNG